MRHTLIRFCKWLLSKLRCRVMVIEPAILTYLPSAEQLAGRQESDTAPGTSGEYKRHVVYSQLQKRFPKASKRDLALAIELALRQ